MRVSQHIRTLTKSEIDLVTNVFGKTIPSNSIMITDGLGTDNLPFTVKLTPSPQNYKVFSIAKKLLRGGSIYSTNEVLMDGGSIYSTNEVLTDGGSIYSTNEVLMGGGSIYSTNEVLILLNIGPQGYASTANMKALFVHELILLKIGIKTA